MVFKYETNDGGWIIGSPGMIGVKLSRDEANDLTQMLIEKTMRAFDKSNPFSAAGTGMVLMAFSVHYKYKNSGYVLKAAELLKSKFFKEDKWASYRHPDN